jgi:kumamolisin
MADMPPQGFTRLSGSERKPPENAQQVGPVDPNERIEVSIYLRSPSTESIAGDDREHAAKPGRRMTREEHSARHSAAPDDLAKIEAFARDHHLTVVEKDSVSRQVVLAGTAAAMMEAFATELQRYEYEGGTFRGRSGHLHIPNELDQIVTGVFGLDNRPQARPRFRQYVLSPVTAQGGATVPISYTPPQVAEFYDFPPILDGSGQCIALIELGGGYTTQELTTYFQKLNIATPNVISVSVDGGQNTPAGKADSDDAEVLLDIEVAGSIAPGAIIAVYFAPNTDRGFLDAITQATNDATNNPSVISISWGAPESDWTTQSMQAIDQAFQAATAVGVTVCCAAGDNGSSDGVTDNKAHVDFPASSPYALGCGGTRLEAANNQIVSEVVWNDLAAGNGATGGGVSDVFGLPSWQECVQVPPSINDKHVGRGVPDVAGNADPETAYHIYVDGQMISTGGTSAVAPLWAGLIALLNQQYGQSVGYLNPFLYHHYAEFREIAALRDITSGNNGGYTAGPGWNACTGLGTPDGTDLLAMLALTLIEGYYQIR